MTTDTSSDELVDARAALDEDAGPLIGRRREAPKRGSFTLVCYDQRDREQHHKLTARTDIDASSIDKYVRRNVPASVKLGAVKDHLLRALVDDDGISVMETVQAVVPPQGGDSSAPAGQWQTVAEAPDDISLADIRYRIGDQTLWDSSEAAEAHAREHGSSLRRFTTIWDDNTLWTDPAVFEDVMDWFGRAGSGDHPTKARPPKSRSRKTKGR